MIISQTAGRMSRNHDTPAKAEKAPDMFQFLDVRFFG